MRTFEDFTKQEPMYVIKVKDKELYLNNTSFGFKGSETTYKIICKYPEIFASRSDCNETLSFYKLGKDKIINDISFFNKNGELEKDNSTVDDLEIKKIKII